MWLLTISVTLILFICYFKSTWWKHLRGIGFVPMDAAWRPPSMHCLLSFIFVTFFILWPFSPAASSVSWYWSCLVCSGLVYEIYSRGVPSMYVYCVVCYCLIVAPYVRSVVMSLHTFTLLMTIRNMRLHYSLKRFLGTLTLTLESLSMSSIRLPFYKYIFIGSRNVQE